MLAERVRVGTSSVLLKKPKWLYSIHGIIYHSPNAFDWYETDTGLGAIVTGIEILNNQYYTFSWNARYAVSEDLDSWSGVRHVPSISRIDGTASGNSSIVVYNDKRIVYTEDGLSWDDQVFSADIRGLFFLKGHYFFVDARGDLFRSLKGKPGTWLKLTDRITSFGDLISYHMIEYRNNLVLFGGSGSRAYDITVKETAIESNEIWFHLEHKVGQVATDGRRILTFYRDRYNYSGDLLINEGDWTHGRVPAININTSLEGLHYDKGRSLWVMFVRIDGALYLGTASSPDSWTFTKINEIGRTGVTRYLGGD